MPHITQPTDKYSVLIDKLKEFEAGTSSSTGKSTISQQESAWLQSNGEEGTTIFSHTMSPGNLTPQEFAANLELDEALMK